MKVQAIKTHKITIKDKNIFTILDKYLPIRLSEKSIVVVTSKIISLCEGSIVRKDAIDKKTLIQKEADIVLGNSDLHNVTITIKNNILLPTAGIDESNAGGVYVLWPKNSQDTANKLRVYLAKKYRLSYLGVIVTDSRSTVMRRGTTGFALAYCGFEGLKNYRGKKDLFSKRRKRFTVANHADALATAAVAVMGEGNEQTPIAYINDVPFVKFVRKNPSQEELDEFHISPPRDLFIPAIRAAKHNKLYGSLRQKKS